MRSVATMVREVTEGEVDQEVVVEGLGEEGEDEEV